MKKLIILMFVFILFVFGCTLTPIPEPKGDSNNYKATSSSSSSSSTITVTGINIPIGNGTYPFQYNNLNPSSTNTTCINLSTIVGFDKKLTSITINILYLADNINPEEAQICISVDNGNNFDQDSFTRMNGVGCNPNGESPVTKTYTINPSQNNIIYFTGLQTNSSGILLPWNYNIYLGGYTYQ